MQINDKKKQMVMCICHSEISDDVIELMWGGGRNRLTFHLQSKAPKYLFNCCTPVLDIASQCDIS